ncbi:glycosyltransferase family 2 protein [Rhizobium helianthi]|uniref:Glycosyltransferase family 2 protein n=1 Tax=Rhizobium helianthi TaxID=1132695 RepID=A0ABW4M3E6_9HYPH
MSQVPLLAEVHLVPVFRGRSRWVYVLFIFLWLAALLNFWLWWLDPTHIDRLPTFLLLTLVMAWITLVPAYFILLFFFAKRIDPGAPLAHGRIAMVVTKAPSEPFTVVKRTLIAMKHQDCPIRPDVWLADEAPSDEVKNWCSENEVQICSRKGVTAYHRREWPRRTRCKEGNLAYFYDTVGYERYDFVAQFDADHAPTPGYLANILKAFNDPGIGYVSAPSLCDANAARSWAARGRLYAEASLHGALQLGYNNGWAPLCIGSHYAVRTAALKEIGGLGPELAEDHSTTLMMNAFGWRGLHAVDAIAHGDGPETFSDLIVQELQWARSLMTILLRYSPQYVPMLPARLRFQFLFAQLWYPLSSLFMAVMFSLPLIALASGHPLASVTWPEFMVHCLPISALLILAAFFWRASGVYRPANAKLFGWEGIAFVCLRWPWALLGCILALGDHLRGGFVDFRITPKGQGATSPLTATVLAPYLGLSMLSSAVIWFASKDGAAHGFFIFAYLNILVYAVGCCLIVSRHLLENGRAAFSKARQSIALTATAFITALAPLGVVTEQAPLAVASLAEGQNFVRLTQTQFKVAGAGLGGKSTIHKFRVHLVGPWNEGNSSLRAGEGRT